MVVFEDRPIIVDERERVVGGDEVGVGDTRVAEVVADGRDQQRQHLVPAEPLLCHQRRLF